MRTEVQLFGDIERAKTSKIRRNFGQLQILVANIFVERGKGGCGSLAFPIFDVSIRSEAIGV